MSENRKVISSVNVTSTDIKCPGCGTSVGLKFDPSTATLSCPYCGLSTQLPTPEDGAVAEELDFNSALQRASVDWGRSKKLIVCDNCGGQTVYDSEQVTGACPFCGSTSVAPASENDSIMETNAVIPFAVSKDEVQDHFISFLKKKKLVKKKAFDCKLENIIGIYLPYWTFDAYTASSYNATRNNGPQAPSDNVTGNWYQDIDDIVIFASDNLRHPYLSMIRDFDFEKAVPYSPEYLAGILAERYSLGLNDAWERSKKLITEKLKKDVRRSDSRLLVKEITTNYYNVKFRCLLAPVYTARYRYGKDTYQVAVNGQTGKTFCQVPTMTERIVFFVILGIFLGFLLICLGIWLLHFIIG
ncbi:MAG: hypothetical protein J5685_02975 [Clostridiales bacterium]|nr:hypothetical protein [Clostridiales bacterium]